MYYKTIYNEKVWYIIKQIDTLVKYDERVRKSPTNIQNGTPYYNKIWHHKSMESWQTDSLAGHIGKGGSLHGENKTGFLLIPQPKMNLKRLKI